MDRAHSESPPNTHPEPDDWPKLVHKLRWMGLEQEAHALEEALSKQPPDQRGCVSAEPSSTD
jgi:hypothetical protein